MARNVIIVSIFISSLVCQINGRVVVSFKLKHYENPTHNELDGGCCDPGCGSCDNRFNICLDVYKGNNDLSDCAYGNFQTKRLYENDDIFDFPASLNDDVTNPIFITVNPWSGGFRSKIDVWDKDNWWDSDDKIDYYGYNYGYTPQRTEALATTRTVTLNGAGTGLLQVEVKVYCAQHYYGTSSGCSTYCVARDNSGGHYDCDDITGGRVCHAGWTGSSCDAAINECGSNPCQNGAACTDLVADYRCNCPPGTEGKNCNDIDECASTPCEHDGTCTDYLNYFVCDCAQRYSGITCQFEIDYCDSRPCQNGATCLGLNDDDVLQCECAPGYEGDTCSVEINECANTTCLNNGTCVDMIGSFACNCSEGYAGVLCESDIRDECASNPCKNNASCVDLVGRFVCVCLSGFVSENCEEDYDECDQNPCVFGNCTDLIDQYSCGCWAGYTGVNCTENIDECVHSQCQHNSTCMDGVNNYTCECLPGYSGLFCEVDVDECQSSPCQNGGMCDDSQMINNYTCDCSSTGFTGDRCELDVDECRQNFACPPDMLCVNVNGSYNCEPLATDSTPLPGVCRSNVCYNDGNCSIINNTYVCVCTKDFMGDLCETPTEPCSPSPCQNEGFCTVITAENGTLHYKCYCNSGYTGVNCTLGLLTGGSKEFTNWYIILVALLILIIIILVLMFLYRSIRERRKKSTSDPDTVFANPHIDSVSLPPFGATAAPPLPPKGKLGQPDSSVIFCSNMYSDIDGVHGARALPEHPPPYDADYPGMENPYAEGAYTKMDNGNATTPREDGNDNHYEFAPDNVPPEVGPAVPNEYSTEPSASASVREPFGIDNSYSTTIFPGKHDILPTVPQSPSSPNDSYSTTIFPEMGAAQSNPYDHPRRPTTPSSPKSTASFPDEYVPASPPSPVTPNSPYSTSILTDGANPETPIEGRSPTTPNIPYSTTIFSDAENRQSVA